MGRRPFSSRNCVLSSSSQAFVKSPSAFLKENLMSMSLRRGNMTFSSAILPSSSRARTSISLGRSSDSNCSDRVSLRSVLEEMSVQG